MKYCYRKYGLYNTKVNILSMKYKIFIKKITFCIQRGISPQYFLIKKIFPWEFPLLKNPNRYALVSCNSLSKLLTMKFSREIAKTVFP